MQRWAVADKSHKLKIRKFADLNNLLDLRTFRYAYFFPLTNMAYSALM
jgi:hypothetical protein